MAASTGGENMDSDNCPVCLDVYRNPKFLPCFHTFCAQCITDIADHHSGGPFPCPSCRKNAILPPGGVAALQTNFYIRSPQSVKKRKLCKIHRNRELEFYCTKCCEVICAGCKMTKHELHLTEDLQTAIERSKKEVATGKNDLQDSVKQLMEKVELINREQQAVWDKKSAIEKNVRDRHALVVATADRCRDEALDSLYSITEDINSELAELLNQLKENMEDLLITQKQLQRATSKDLGSDIISVAKAMKRGHSNKQNLSRLLSQELRAIRRPVLQFEVTGDVLLQKVQDFMGKVTEMETEGVAVPEVKVAYRFQCGEEADVEVYSLCHVDSDPPVVCVSYERRGMKENVPVQLYSEEGESIDEGAESGKVSYTRFGTGQVMSSLQQAGLVRTYAKSPDERTGAHIRLSNDFAGSATIASIRVTSVNRFQTETKEEFSISVGPHRTFDVDSTGNYYAVVEEPQLPDIWRKVHLYRRPGKDPVSTYEAPVAFCQPSDVCFYTLRGYPVLLVADELNDAVHVVDFKAGRLSFERFLAPGCPLLIQPTAITIDVYNRLWLACRGGTIITMQRLKQSP